MSQFRTKKVRNSKVITNIQYLGFELIIQNRTKGLDSLEYSEHYLWIAP